MRKLAQSPRRGHPAASVLEKVLDRADGIPFVLEQICCQSMPKAWRTSICCRKASNPPFTRG